MARELDHFCPEQDPASGHLCSQAPCGIGRGGSEGHQSPRSPPGTILLFSLSSFTDITSPFPLTQIAYAPNSVSATAFWSTQVTREGRSIIRKTEDTLEGPQEA